MLEKRDRTPGVVVTQLNGVNGKYSGGKVAFCTTEWLQGDWVTKTYRYSLRKRTARWSTAAGWAAISLTFWHRPAPARVYGRALEVYPGLKLTRGQFVEELQGDRVSREPGAERGGDLQDHVEGR